MTRKALWKAAVTLAAILMLASTAHADDNGLRLVDSKQLSSRLTELVLKTDALRTPTRVRVLLPDGYAEHPTRHYPVLYLLHGGFDNYASWTDKGAAEQITAGAPLIVVMPDDGNGGWYTNWRNGGRGGPPLWETYHIRQLMPWIDATYRTIPERQGRAVAGLSAGGFGAMSYAARHPDLFAWAGSYSGALDIVGNLPVAAAIASAAVADGGCPDDVFGSRVFEERVWRAHNPRDLAENLRGTELYVAAGNGQSGPYDTGPRLDPVEQQTHDMSVAFHQRLRELGIGHVWNDYGPGTHTWPYWQRDLRETLPLMLNTLTGNTGNARETAQREVTDEQRPRLAYS
jgi:diacylglycerol O-acyltransferase / trehalose O-mycolyltransferase